MQRFRVSPTFTIFVIAMNLYFVLHFSLSVVFLIIRIIFTCLVLGFERFRCVVAVNCLKIYWVN